MRVLIVRLDAIGDYVIWRTCFRALRTSARFRNAHITLLGNRAWKHLFEAVDADLADDTIWVNPSDYIKKSIDNLFPFIWQWRSSLHRERRHLRDLLSEKKFDVILLPTVCRNPLMDRLFAGLAPELWGVASTTRLPTDPVFTQLAPVPPNTFIFQQNSMVLDFLAGEACNIRSLGPLIDRALRSDSRTVAIFPGASHWTKRWPINAFAKVAQYIIDAHGLDVVVLGGPHDVSRADKLISKTNRAGRIRSEAGQGTLMDMAKNISNATFLVSNDTCASHIGAAQHVPTICITNGIMGRNLFWPYPPEMHLPFAAVTAENVKSPVGGLLATHVCCYWNLLTTTTAKVIIEVNTIVNRKVSV